ncbi:MAG: endonuclease III [Bacteroidales bacterium]|nr:endonuclease III [Candidatus Colimorpha onthohippi]
MTTKERYQQVLAYFEKAMPDAATELHYNNTFELLVAVMLSAQCTDKRVNMVTPQLFAAYPNAASMAQAPVEDVLRLIKSISYPNDKSRHLIAMAQQLMERYDGKVPDTLEALQTLPGVGRKTANVMLAVAFDKPAMPVDTHVFRVANRIGLARQCTTPLQTEQQLLKYIPTHQLTLAHHWLILHGRYTCTARNPKCESCNIAIYCQWHTLRNHHSNM